MRIKRQEEKTKQARRNQARRAARKEWDEKQKARDAPPGEEFEFVWSEDDDDTQNEDNDGNGRKTCCWSRVAISPDTVLSTVNRGIAATIDIATGEGKHDDDDDDNRPCGYDGVVSALLQPKTAEEVVQQPQLWALDLAADVRVGVDRMARRDAYVLCGVEALTAEEKSEQKDRQYKDANDSVGERVMGAIQRALSPFLFSFVHVFATILVCLAVPLPMAVIAFAHQNTYFTTTAVAPQVVVQDLFLSSSPYPKDLLVRQMLIENAIMLSLGLVYYAVSAVKLVLFHTDYDPKSCLRVFWRHLWVSLTSFYFLLYAGYCFMALQWIILGAVLNPTSILPYSVAVGGAVGFVAASIHSIKSIRRR